MSITSVIDSLKNPQGLFHAGPLALLCAAFATLFLVLVVIYSIGSMKGVRGLWRYYSYLLATFVLALGVLFSTNFMLLLVCWGLLGLTLFLLIGFGTGKGTAEAARKTMILVGGTDALLLLGMVLLWRLYSNGSLGGIFTMHIGASHRPLDGGLAVTAYLCMASAAFAKAGLMPFHSWIPDAAESSPIPVTAFLPASLDKLLGIYFLAKLSLDVFRMTPAMNTVLMALGSITIVGAVMMALVQHDLRRLLGYHAVSQVGYMVLGIGTGVPLGIAGGLFHMFNHSIYKSCLFLSAGAAEKRAGTSDLDKMGGLARVMPLVFGAFLVASLSISGVPPFNGFASKWLVYQGILRSGDPLWVLWLVAAMLGSALTIASFMKLLHAVFLGQPSEEVRALSLERKPAGFSTGFPLVVLASLCLALGVFAWRIPFGELFRPLVTGDLRMPGVWQSGLATLMILAGLVLGLLFYLVGRVRTARTAPPFVGGEPLDRNPSMRLSGTDFYRTVSDLGFLRVMYRLAAKKLFDLYVVCDRTAAGVGAVFSFMHNGLLSRYLLWFLIGLVVICFMLI